MWGLCESKVRALQGKKKLSFKEVRERVLTCEVREGVSYTSVLKILVSSCNAACTTAPLTPYKHFLSRQVPMTSPVSVRGHFKGPTTSCHRPKREMVGGLTRVLGCLPNEGQPRTQTSLGARPLWRKQIIQAWWFPPPKKKNAPKGCLHCCGLRTWKNFGYWPYNLPGLHLGLIRTLQLPTPSTKRVKSAHFCLMGTKSCTIWMAGSLCGETLLLTLKETGYLLEELELVIRNTDQFTHFHNQTDPLFFLLVFAPLFFWWEMGGGGWPLWERSFYALSFLGPGWSSHSDTTMAQLGGGGS